MTTEYSISVNEWNSDDWNYVGCDTVRSFCESNPKKAAKMFGYELTEEGTIEYLDERVDDQFPMMLYAYPLLKEPTEDEILKVCAETNCTVVQKIDTEDYYLALTGGGMDLSQDIALAYIIAQGYIPDALAMNVSTQEGLSKYGKQWIKVMRECKHSLRLTASSYSDQVKRINSALREYSKKEKIKRMEKVK